MTADLYRNLGVPRDADTAAIRRAYRKAAKRNHPDMPGGSKERFALIALAHDTLTDDARRRHYDETGEAEQKPVDNAQSEALHCLAAALEATLGECASSNREPITVDLADKMRRWIRNHLAECSQQVGQLREAIGNNERLGQRFRGEVMQQIISGRVMMLREKIAQLERQERSGTAGLALLEDVGFTADPAPPQALSLASMFSTTTRF